MSNLPQLVVVGIAAVVALCFVHGRIDTVLPRAKFVVLALWGVGSLPVGYSLIWVLAGQQPDFNLFQACVFGLTLWAAALAYATLVVLCKRDMAPSK